MCVRCVQTDCHLSRDRGLTMTTYRVGASGATVFDEDGCPLVRLRPGVVVVPGSTEVSGSPAARIADNPKRLREYSDKRLRPHEDKT